MSRKSPSGSVAVTDQVFAFGSVNDVSTLTPGLYYVVPSILSTILATSGASITPESGSATVPEIAGSEASKGRLDTTRVAFVADPTSAGSAPIVLQWSVNGVLVGDPVSIPWTTAVFPTTVIEGCALAKGTEYDFGDVFWNAGDVILLAVTIAVLPIGVAAMHFGITFDKNYA